MAEQVTDYRLVTGSDAYSLENEIKPLLIEGWQPLGGVSVIRYESTNERKGYKEDWWLFSQAMVKVRQPPQPDDRPDEG
jgi:hypothetical protein